MRISPNVDHCVVVPIRLRTAFQLVETGDITNNNYNYFSSSSSCLLLFSNKENLFPKQ